MSEDNQDKENKKYKLWDTNSIAGWVGNKVGSILGRSNEDLENYNNYIDHEDELKAKVDKEAKEAFDDLPEEFKPGYKGSLDRIEELKEDPEVQKKLKRNREAQENKTLIDHPTLAGVSAAGKGLSDVGVNVTNLAPALVNSTYNSLTNSDKGIVPVLKNKDNITDAAHPNMYSTGNLTGNAVLLSYGGFKNPLKKGVTELAKDTSIGGVTGAIATPLINEAEREKQGDYSQASINPLRADFTGVIGNSLLGGSIGSVIKPSVRDNVKIGEYDPDIHRPRIFTNDKGEINSATDRYNPTTDFNTYRSPADYSAEGYGLSTTKVDIDGNVIKDSKGNQVKSDEYSSAVHEGRSYPIYKMNDDGSIVIKKKDENGKVILETIPNPKPFTDKINRYFRHTDEAPNYTLDRPLTREDMRIIYDNDLIPEAGPNITKTDKQLTRNANIINKSNPQVKEIYINALKKYFNNLNEEQRAKYFYDNYPGHRKDFFYENVDPDNPYVSLKVNIPEGMRKAYNGEINKPSTTLEQEMYINKDKSSFMGERSNDTGQGTRVNWENVTLQDIDNLDRRFTDSLNQKGIDLHKSPELNARLKNIRNTVEEYRKTGKGIENIQDSIDGLTNYLELLGDGKIVNKDISPNAAKIILGTISEPISTSWLNTSSLAYKTGRGLLHGIPFVGPLITEILPVNIGKFGTVTTPDKLLKNATKLEGAIKPNKPNYTKPIIGTLVANSNSNAKPTPYVPPNNSNTNTDNEPDNESNTNPKPEKEVTTTTDTDKQNKKVEGLLDDWGGAIAGLIGSFSPGSALSNLISRDSAVRIAQNKDFGYSLPEALGLNIDSLRDMQNANIRRGYLEVQQNKDKYGNPISALDRRNATKMKDETISNLEGIKVIEDVKRLNKILKGLGFKGTFASIYSKLQSLNPQEGNKYYNAFVLMQDLRGRIAQPIISAYGKTNVQFGSILDMMADPTKTFEVNNEHLNTIEQQMYSTAKSNYNSSNQLYRGVRDADPYTEEEHEEVSSALTEAKEAINKTNMNSTFKTKDNK